MIGARRLDKTAFHTMGAKQVSIANPTWAAFFAWCFFRNRYRHKSNEARGWSKNSFLQDRSKSGSHVAFGMSHMFRLLAEACPQHRCSNRLGQSRCRPISAKAGRGKGLGKIAVGPCWPKHAPSIGAATGLVKTDAGQYSQKLVGGRAHEKTKAVKRQEV